MSFVGGFLRALIPLSLGVAILAHPYPARAEKRVALVIGNSGYEHITKLRNATNDAKLLTRHFPVLASKFYTRAISSKRKCGQAYAPFYESWWNTEPIPLDCSTCWPWRSGKRRELSNSR